MQSQEVTPRPRDALVQVSIDVVEIRAATPSDSAALASVHAETWVDTYVGKVADELAEERVARARARDWTEHRRLRSQLGGGVLVLAEDGGVVGFCEFGPTEDPDDDPRRVGHIMRLYVAPTHQGRGGGRRLLDAACRRLRELGFESVTLWTAEEEWNAAHGFYVRLGWLLEDAHQTDGDIRYRLPLP